MVFVKRIGSFYNKFLHYQEKLCHSPNSSTFCKSYCGESLKKIGKRKKKYLYMEKKSDAD